MNVFLPEYTKIKRKYKNKEKIQKQRENKTKRKQKALPPTRKGLESMVRAQNEGIVRPFPRFITVFSGLPDQKTFLRQRFFTASSYM